MARGDVPPARVPVADPDAWASLADALLARHAVGARTDVPTGEACTANDALAEARERFAESLRAATAFSALVANADVPLGDAEVLALAVACEIDDQRQRLLARVQDDPHKRRLTLGGVVRLFDGQHPGVLSVGPDAPLRRAALVDVEADGPWSDHVVVTAPAVIWALVGDGSRDPDLPLAVDHLEVDDDGGSPFVVVNGPDRFRRRQVAARNTLGARFLVSPVPATEQGWAALVREATLTGCGLIVELEDELPSAGRRWIERALHLPWALSTRNELPLVSLPDRERTELDAAALEPTDEEWTAVFGPGTPRTHRLTPDQLQLVGRAFRARDHDLDAAVRRLGSGQLERLARRIRPRRTWDDIVLSSERVDQLHTIAHRYRFADRVYNDWGFTPVPSSGVVALFSGPSGTGKTMATEIVAGELGLDVFKLDLSSVVSKYIGETEKNLEQIFDAAGAGNLVLFFDEADALFGKRSEVRDARDRYANIEVSYLLQRLESYDGLVVLATNFEKNVDEAFLRRIHVRVEFSLPAERERAAIWELNLPDEAPRADIDVVWLAARFDLSGAGIRNAAVDAAFSAAAEDTPITMGTLVRGVAREYMKLGRLLKREDFGDHYDAIAPRSTPPA